MDHWDWNGPEEGDTIDLSVIIMFDGEEVIELNEEDTSVAKRKAMAKLICGLLNQAGAITL